MSSQPMKRNTSASNDNGCYFGFLQLLTDNLFFLRLKKNLELNYYGIKVKN